MIVFLFMRYKTKLKKQNPPVSPFNKGELRGICKEALFISLLFIATIINGCAGKAILSDDAAAIRKTSDFVNELKDLYERRDEHVLALFSQEYLTSAGEMRKAILKDLERFNSISLNLFIDRIEMSGEQVNITVHWNGAWKGTEKTFREGGSMVLLASYGDPIRITGVKGDSPFGISSMLSRHED